MTRLSGLSIQKCDTILIHRQGDKMATKEKKTEYFYNAGADDYNLLLFVIIALVGVGCVGFEIYRAMNH